MDDQTFMDRKQGEKIREALLKTNGDRPPLTPGSQMIYVPDDPEFFRAVAQRLRLED